VTASKPIAVQSQYISSVNTINPLVGFYDIHGRKGEVLFFYFVPDTTLKIKSQYHYNYKCFICKHHDTEASRQKLVCLQLKTLVVKRLRTPIILVQYDVPWYILTSVYTFNVIFLFLVPHTRVETKAFVATYPRAIWNFYVLQKVPSTTKKYNNH
jgi:hypothetical protein